MQAFKYHENAKRKPVVAMLPVVSHVEDYLPWSLSEEFTAELQRRLINHSVVFLNAIDVPVDLQSKIAQSDTVSLNLNELQGLRAQNDFVVLLELIEHSEKGFHLSDQETLRLGDSIDRTLEMRMRVKVLDLRAEKPKVILHEVMPSEFVIPKEPPSMNGEKAVWGCDAYPASAYGRAHAKLEKALVKQIENYISIAH